jgi:hypothetical protein
MIRWLRLGQYDTLTLYHDLTQTSGDKVDLTTYSYDNADRMTAEANALGTSGSTVLTYGQTYDLRTENGPGIITPPWKRKEDRIQNPPYIIDHDRCAAARGIELTYLQQEGDGDAITSGAAFGGDQYTGLDRFGRVAKAGIWAIGVNGSV